MKKSAALALLFLAGSANAEMNDNFTCQIRALQPDGSIVFGSKSSFASVKQSLNESPIPNVRISSGSMTMTAYGSGSNRADLAIVYQQAYEVDAHGVPTRAKQSLCFTASATVSSTSTATACPPPSLNPFEENASGWDPVTIANGELQFNIQQLHPLTIPFPDGVKVTLECVYEGSTQ